MNIKEYEDNRYTKQKTEIEKYLLRIIQRYFDIENNDSNSSIEAIIVESITRLKRILITEKGFIFSLNQKTGHITLTIGDFGGEESFEKNTAFNKDFGIEADTICEGNDPRLSDAREPLQHTHIIADINGLQEELDKIGIPEGLHLHRNKNVLDLIRYTGASTQIDLILIERLVVAIDEYYKNLEYYKRELKATHKKDIEDLSVYISSIERELQMIKDFIETAIAWLPDAKKYTDTQINKFSTDMLALLMKYVTKEQVQGLIDFFKKPLYFIGDGEIPILDGEITCFPVEEEVIIEASSEDGDSLKAIYDEGLKLGEDNWIWDDSINSFVYTENIQNSYPMFISLSAFDSYTHRVTLKSTDSDDDVISVVIVYDEATNSNVSILCSTGGCNSASSGYKTNASVVLNYNHNYTMSGEETIGTPKTFDGYSGGWNNVPNGGITVLIKRDKNNIKIWVNATSANEWNPEEIDGKKNIYPTTPPDWDFNLTDYEALSCFVDKPSKYGYGTFSQAMSFYSDVYFMAPGVAFEEPYGHTNISEANEISFSIPSNIMSRVHNGNVKMFFRYEKDGSVIDTAIPFTFVTDDKKLVIVQAAYDNNGRIYIQTNLLNTLSAYITPDNFYSDDFIIAAISLDPRTYMDADNHLQNQGCNLCLIDSDAKTNFVNNLLLLEKEYFIQGHTPYESDEQRIIDNNGNSLSYTNWDDDQPIYNDTISLLYINKNQKWAIAEDWNRDEKGYVLEYKVKRLSQYFNNPRVYYQVFGNKEV